jgi:hypothetical protein
MHDQEILEEVRSMKKPGIRLSALLTVLLLVCLASPQGAAGASPQKKPAEPANVSLVGTRFGPDMLRGYEEVGGGVMSDEHHRMTDWAIQLVRKDGVDMVWLSHVTGTDPSGRSLYQIADVLRLPPRKKDEIVTWFSCCYAGRLNDAIIAYTDKYFYRVHRTWVANRRTGRIEEVSTRGIVCQDPAAQP